VADEDERGRAGTAREHARLRATLGEEPGSGYAFHDEVVVERLRGSIASASVSTRRMASSPRPSVTSRKALVSATSEERSYAPDERAEPAPEDSLVRDTRRSLAHDDGDAAHTRATAPGPGSSSKPPPLPSAAARTPSIAPAAPTGLTPPSGAIWHALPPVLSGEPAAPHADAPPAAAALFAPSQEIPTVPLRSRPPPDFLGPRANRSADARLLRIEPLVARSAWDQVLVELTHERELTPLLTLIRLIARREIEPSSDAQTRHAAAHEATSAVATLLGVTDDSPLALVVAKRLLRKNPRDLRSQHASTGVSVGMIVAGIVIGVGLGFVLTRVLL
jgi:hypothetical protein